jgi:glucose/arabinose dehydrogenase
VLIARNESSGGRSCNFAESVTAVALTGALSSPSAPGAAQPQNLEKAQADEGRDHRPEHPVVPQTGKNADAIRENLKRIKLPPGFKIELFAIVPDARHMAVAPSTNMLFVGTRKTTVWAVTDRNSDGVADEVQELRAEPEVHEPERRVLDRDGFLIVAEHNRVLNFPAAEFFYEGPDVAVIEVVPQGQLVPPEEESYNHGARTCRVSDDGKLYITLGQPYNVQPRDKVAMYEKLGIGGMVRLNAFDGSGREVVARGCAQFGRHGHQPQGQGCLVHRQSDRRHG